MYTIPYDDATAWAQRADIYKAWGS